MRADIDLDDEAYKGRKTSRKALALDEDGFLDSSPQLAGSEGDEEEDGLGLSEGLEDDEDEDGGSDADAGTDGADMDSQGDEGEEDEPTEGQLGTEGGSEDPEGGWRRSQGLVGSDEADELQRMYEAQADGAALVEGVKQRVQKERAKGLAVRNQQVSEQAWAGVPCSASYKCHSPRPGCLLNTMSAPWHP
jgi:protein AATF/BFR2